MNAMLAPASRAAAARMIHAAGALAAIALLTAATCGRPVSVESEGAADVTPTTYQIEVLNRTADDLVVYYGPAEQPIRLGVVGGESSERFFVTALSGAEIRVYANDPDGEGEPIERRVLLVQDEVVEVELRREADDT